MLLALKRYGTSCKTIDAFRTAAQRNQIEIQYSKGQIKWSTGKDTNLYFSRIDGQLLSAQELSLHSRRGAPLPDIVCRCLPSTILRTRFYRAGAEIEHQSAAVFLDDCPRPGAVGVRGIEFRQAQKRRLVEKVVAEFGENLRGTPGMLARVFGAISDINVRMISQGASEINISFVIEEKDVNEAVRRLHAMLLADLDGKPRDTGRVNVPASVSPASSVVKSRRVRGNGSGRDKTPDLNGASRKHTQGAVR